MTSSMRALVWLRNDLRLVDNPALRVAKDDADNVIVLYVLEDDSAAEWQMGGASRWWLHHSLHALQRALRACGNKLIVRRGSANDVVTSLVAECGISHVYWNRRYEPWAIDHDRQLKTALLDDGITVQTYNGSLLREPWELKTGAGKPYQVFTPFWKAQLAQPAPDSPLPGIRRLAAPEALPSSLSLADLDLLPTKPDWTAGLAASWQPGEAGAAQALKQFVDNRIGGYDEGRDRPDKAATSALSPHLRFGEVSVRQIWHTVLAAATHKTRADAMAYLREIGWRDFSYNLLFHFPELPDRNLKVQFDQFAWQRDDSALQAWQTGQTGYPIVDAGMRQLWHTGWMHNRVRMVAASFLIKHLMTHWREGERWFWDTLVDADLASNAASWQWVAGCGADAAPYFRIFNPIIQGQKFDPQGDYVRHWVPELARLDKRVIHSPWTATEEALAAAGVTLGRTYPKPVVDHKEARERALSAYSDVRATSP